MERLGTQLQSVLGRLPEFETLSPQQQARVTEAWVNRPVPWWSALIQLVVLLVILPVAPLGLLAPLWLGLGAGVGVALMAVAGVVELAALVAYLVWLDRLQAREMRRVIAAAAWNGRAEFCVECGHDLRWIRQESCPKCGASRWVEPGSGRESGHLAM